MRTASIILTVATCYGVASLASEPESPQTTPARRAQDLPAPLGCTDEGTLIHGSCSRGLPVYLPDGDAIDYLRTKKTVSPDWPPETDEAIKARLNLEIVVLPDGTVKEIRPTFLRVTLPGENERRMDPTEDRYGFVRAASEAVAKWRYEPRNRAATSLAVYGSVCFDFSAAAEDRENEKDDDR
jgi:hypothetical protein